MYPTLRLCSLSALAALALLLCGASLAAEPAPAAAATPVRGVWIPTYEHTDFFASKASMARWLDELEADGFNTVYVAMWNQGRTLYPSQVMKRLSGVEIDEKLAGRDPLRELLEVAKGRKIKVVAWFEFGFASDYKGGPGKELVSLKPQWAALNAQGKQVEKNGFHWLNALDPEVQDFVLSLILEVVEHYEVDGIQGDDRLPALPSSAGYNPAVVARYQAEHAGKSPPADYKDAQWVQWRADILTQFLGRLYREVKQRKPAMRISMSPSPYPWGRDEYLQDWPKWLENGWVDEVLPQLYRYDIKAYEATLAEMVAQLSPAQRRKVFPGVLLALGKSYVAPAGLLKQMVAANRAAGIDGEVFFFNEGVRKQRGFFGQLYR